MSSVWIELIYDWLMELQLSWLAGNQLANWAGELANLFISEMNQIQANLRHSVTNNQLKKSNAASIN